MMVTEWGMSELLGFQHFGTREEVLFLGREVNKSNEISEETARKIDSEIKRILDECYQQALDVLTHNRETLDLLTNLLIERETLDGRDVDDVLKHGRIRTAAERNADPEVSEKTETPEAPATVMAEVVAPPHPLA